MNYVTYLHKIIIKGKYLVPAVLFVSLIFLSNSGYTSTSPKGTVESYPVEQKLKKQLSEKWGIEVTALRMTAADRMIDFRYRILDKDKAAPLHKRQIKPYLIHETSGKVLAVPNTAKVGSLRNSNMPQEGRIYWMFFGNQGVVKNGDKVSVVIGDFRADNLIVQ